MSRLKETVMDKEALLGFLFSILGIYLFVTTGEIIILIIGVVICLSSIVFLTLDIFKGIS